MKKIVLTTLVFLLTATSLLADIVVERSSADGMDLSLSLPGKQELVPVRVSSKVFNKLVISDEGFVTMGRYPEKEYQRRVYQIAVPENCSPKLEILSIHSRDVDADDLITAQKLITTADGISYYDYALSDKSVLPEVNPVELQDMGYSDGNRIYAINFHPLYFSGRQAKLVDEVQVRVSYGASFAKYPSLKKQADCSLPQLLNNQYAVNNKSKPLSKSSTFLEDIKTAWVKMSVAEDGIYKVTGSQLSALGGIDISKIAVDRLSVYSSAAGPLPDDPNQPLYHGARPVARKVVDVDGDGRFDAEDYLLFYGQAPVSWNRGAKPAHYYTDYSTKSYYWINPGIDGAGTDVLDMPLIPAAKSGKQDEINSFRRFYVNDSRKQFYYDGEGKRGLWFGYKIAGNETFSLELPIENFQDSAVCNIRYESDVKSDVLISYYLNNSTTAAASTSQTLVNLNLPASGILSGSTNYLKLKNKNSSDFKPFLSLELLYNGTITADGKGKSFFKALGTAGQSSNYRLKLNGAAGRELFDITDPLNVKYRKLDADFCDVRIDERKNYFYHLSGSGYLTPSELSVYDNRAQKSLHSLVNNYSIDLDLLIIAPDEFYDYMADDAGGLISTHKATDAAFKTAEVVRLSQINNEFGQGYQEPAATRNFIKYFANTLTANGKKLRNVLLVGDGNNDYQNIFGYKSVNFIYPSDIRNDSHVGSDDYYAAINSMNAASVDVSVGRFPVMNLTELRSVVEKTNEFMLNPNPGLAGQTALLLGDDEIVREGTSFSHLQTEHIDKIEKRWVPMLPKSVIQKKVYLTEYQEAIDPSSSTVIKPGSANDVVRYLNQGVKLFAYSGHGRPDKLAHEKAFAPDIWNSVNNRSYFLMMGATCSFGVFDTHDTRGLAEQMLVAPKRGGIGMINNTRPCYADGNTALFALVFKHIFNGDYSIGEALQMAKKSYAGTNSAGFMLLGDPALKIFRTKEIVKGPQFLTLTTLQKDSIVSFVEGQSNFNGKLLTAIYDAEKTVHYRKRYLPDTTTAVIDYTLPGNLIVPANSVIKNGSSSAKFILPKDLNYGNSGAKVVFYGYNDNLEQVSGFVTNVSIAGSQAANDTIPPELSVMFNGFDYKYGDPIGSDPVVYVIMKDENGINLSGGIGHKLLLELDGQETEAGNYFNYFDNSYQEGYVQYQYLGLSEGVHNLKIISWDTFNNFSSKTVEFKVETSKPGEEWVGNLLNYPNPIRNNGTTFTFNLNRPQDVDKLKITVYTINGRKVKVLDDFNVNTLTQSQQVRWDGRDADGDIPANGVYFYKIDVRYNYLDETANSRSKNVYKIGKLLFAR